MNDDIRLLDRWLKLRDRLLLDLPREDRETLQWHLDRVAAKTRELNRLRNGTEAPCAAR